MTLHNVYFSGKGTTKTCATTIRTAIGLESKPYPWHKNPPKGPIDIPAEDVLLLSMPVYGGFIPRICLPWVEQLKGHGGPAVIAAVYGNRHYDNALIQMKQLLEKQGFRVIAAGAFLAEHSIFTDVAKGRPDADDMAAMSAFGWQCARMLSGDWKNAVLEVSGDPNFELPEQKPAGMFPTGDDTCVNCRACADVCPGKAIQRAHPKETDPAKCIQCGACIAVCHTGSRQYHSAAWAERAPIFAEKCAEYRKPETFFAK